MSSRPLTYRAKYLAPSAPILKAQTSATGMWRKAVLTFPRHDLAGDYVEPSGLSFAPHRLDWSIDLEHGRDPSVRGMPVAWARESLSDPGAPYGVEYVRLNVADSGHPPEWHDLPVGTSYFDKSCRISSQVFALVESDALPAVSLEFRAVPGFMKSLGRSPLENRDACHFGRADVLRWSICARGVNEGALFGTVAKSIQQVPDPLARILADNRVNVGGRFEPLCEVIRKALAPYAPKPTGRTVVRVETKAMDTGTATTDDSLDTSAETEAAAGDEAPALGGVSAKYKFAQGIKDLRDEYEQDMQSSDSPELRKMAEKFMAMADKLAAMVVDAADKHDAKLTGGSEEGEEGDEGDDGEEGDEEEVEKALQCDGDGVIVTRRPVYQKALKIKRFKLAELQKAQEQEAQEPVVVEAPETAEEALARIRREEPEAWKEIERTLRVIDACA